MSKKFQYSKVIKYLVKATCIEPLHIGSATGEKETVLIHPVDNVPFIQASSLAGVFRAYYEKKNENDLTQVEELFGSSKFAENENSSEYGSKVCFSDGKFVGNVALELRPRVKINAVSGTCDSSVISGTEQSTGHKFLMEYIGAGAKIEFVVYLYDMEKKEKFNYSNF